MKISYNVLKNFIKNIYDVENLSKKLIMHTAEVEQIEKIWKNLEKVFIWYVLETKKHPDSDKLNICRVRVLWEEKQIVCWAANIRKDLKVAVATVWRELWEWFIITKSKIRWEVSEWMICSLDELWITKNRQEWIWEMPEDSIEWTCLRDYLKKDDFIIEIDNKAINHRPDMFSYMWVIREINTINNIETTINYENIDFENIKKTDINITSPYVWRYMLAKVSWVKNIESNNLIKTIIEASWHENKGLLIDLSNYSLYFYWQPTHIFDADKVVWEITVRQAKNDEKILALNDIEYNLNEKDIVIADDEKILAIAWIIWAKNSCVDENTKNIYIESAHFDQAVLRFTWKRLWLRTDSLNIFEKDTIKEMCDKWLSLIINELKNIFDCKIECYSDFYKEKETTKKIDFSIDYIKNLIWVNYDIKNIENILNNLWIKLINNQAIIPFWRKDINYLADIAEEIARIDWYHNIPSTIPNLNLWAIMQDNIYLLKQDIRNYFSSIWFYDVYNYTFVNENIYKKLWIDINECVKLKNALSEEQTHLRNSLIPNLIKWLQDNIKDKKEISLFEVEKCFFKKWSEITEDYFLSWVITSKKDIIYYELQEIIVNLFKRVFSQNFYFDKKENIKTYEHAWRTANIIMWWKNIWAIWEIHPIIANKFDIEERIWFFEINLTELSQKVYNTKKAKEISSFQENNFDLSFVIDKKIKWRDILLSIAWADKEHIKNVEIFSVYEDEQKLPWKRSISFKIYIQSLTETLSDEFKNNLIKEIISKVDRKWWTLR